MNPVEALLEYLRSAHPDAVASVTPPLQSAGVWSLDLDMADKRLAIQWTPDSGFGLSSVSAESFGEGPDEVFDSLDQVKKRVNQLLTSDEQTSPPIGVLLARLRERKGLTQEELADRLSVRQATISGMERRRDIQLSTLRRVVDALGGMLEVFGSFPEGTYRLISSLRTHKSFGPCAAEESFREGDFGHYLHRETVFVSLREAGTLRRAENIAIAIKDRHSITEHV